MIQNLKHRLSCVRLYRKLSEKMSSEIVPIPGKGVLSRYIQTKHDEILCKNKERYEEIMRRLIKDQLNFDAVFHRVKKMMDDYNKQLSNSVGVYLSLDVGELFQVGSEEGLLLIGKDGYVVNFANPRDYIREYNKTPDGKKALSQVFQLFFENCPILEEWKRDCLRVWFDSANHIGEGSCYWYEKSGNLEIKFYVSVAVREEVKKV